MKKIKGLFAIFLIILLITGCENNNDTYKRKMLSETFCLSGIEEKNFYQLPTEINEVYGYDKNGNKVFYDEDDYSVDYDNGTIRRTEYSSIPDYKNHKVIKNDNNKFDFTSEPRNPELNVLYQIHVSYIYQSEKALIANESNYLSAKTTSKLEKGKTINITVAGDSISVGAQTTSQYFFGDCVNDTFVGLLKRELEKTYGCHVELTLVSQAGTDRYYMIENLDMIIDSKPDVVIVEFGMNDHAVDAPMDLEKCSSFENDMRNIIFSLKNEGIDVVLVGFFQQNDDWVMENVSATEKYNSILESIAKENNVYFADVKSLFEKVGVRKNVVEDVTVDYMHHPSDWGHMLYYSTIVPVFNVNNCIKADVYYID